MFVEMADSIKLLQFFQKFYRKFQNHQLDDAVRPSVFFLFSMNEIHQWEAHSTPDTQYTCTLNFEYNFLKKKLVFSDFTHFK